MTNQSTVTVHLTATGQTIGAALAALSKSVEAQVKAITPENKMATTENLASETKTPKKKKLKGAPIGAADEEGEEIYETSDDYHGDEEVNDDESYEEDVDADEEEEVAPVKTKAKKSGVTLETVQNALQAYRKRNGKDALKMKLRQFKVTSIQEIPETMFSKILSAVK